MPPPEHVQVRKTVTVLFADVAGSTSLGERLDPESLREVMARYFDVARTVLERHGGSVEKYIGDAVMAVFGVPVAHEDDALRAVRAAVEIRDALAELDRDCRETWGTGLQARTGVDTGEVVAGDPTSGQAFVSGDAVNVAARLEQAAEPGQILIAADTLRLVRDAVLVEPTGPLSLKGKSEAVVAFRLLDVLPGAAPFTRRLDSPMVGRALELGQLSGTFERAVAGPCCELVTIVGPAGIGKSRLIRELLTRLPGPARAVVGRCLPYGDGLTFWPLAEMVRQAAGIDDRASPTEARQRILRLMPDQAEDASLIADRVAAALGIGAAPGAIQETYWAVRRLFETLAAERPVVAVFEDIHWAEPALLDLIEYLARFSRDRPLLLLATARPEIRDDRPDWGRVGTVVTLAPLDAADGERLMRNLVGQARLPPAVHERVLAAAEGNPLFVEELLRMLVDDDVLALRDGHWIVQGDASIAPIPATIQAIVSARLDRLDTEERELIQRASVIGRVFYWSAISELSPDAARARVGGHLQTLLGKELIKPEASPFAGDDAFRFGHILVRDVAYDSIPKRIRVDLHERFASWLERVAGVRIAEYEEVVGYHLEMACRYLAEVGPVGERGAALAARAAAHLAASGRRSHGRGDMRAAASLLSRAAGLLAPSDATRLELLPLLGAALTETGRLDEADRVLGEAIELARAAADHRTEASARFRWLYVWAHSDPAASFREALAEAQAAIPLVGEGDDLDLSEGWRTIGMLHFWQGQIGAAEEALERSAIHARRSGDRHQEVEVARWQTMCLLYGPCPAPEALRRLSDIEARYGSTDRMAGFQVARIRSELEGIQGRFDMAREAVGAAKRLAGELGLGVPYAGGVLRHSGYIEYLAGDLDAAERELREGCRLLELLGDRGHLASVAACLADVLWVRGRDDEARSLADIGRAASTEDDVDAQVRWRGVEAKVLARRGDARKAERLLDEAVELAARTDYLDLHALALMDQVEVLRLGDRAPEAVPVLRQALALFEQKGNVVMAGRAAALLAELGPRPSLAPSRSD